VRLTHRDIDFRFEEASGVAEFIQLATRPETKLALFIPPGNLERDPDASYATPEQEAARIVRAVKAKNDIPVIVLAVQSDVRKAVLEAGASMFLEIPAQAQQLVDAFAECLGLAPRTIAP
jgi:dihydropteroate synthase